MSKILSPKVKLFILLVMSIKLTIIHLLIATKLMILVYFLYNIKNPITNFKKWSKKKLTFNSG